ncbi:MAG: NAD(P)-dependent oxidoreductase [Bdellovibrionaceae bacterium]|nr:NAD(P)-dependent oxidoreductase [Pseudobdellovibrionaceae bacterium]
MKVLVLGASSFVAKSVFKYFNNSQKFEFIGMQRKLLTENTSTTNKGSSLWALGNAIPENILESCDWIFHCAHDFNSAEINLVGGHKLIQQLKKFPEKKVIFISSYSAFADADSDYGKIKYQLENLFLENGHYILRPGLIVGEGGMFFKLFKSILKYPIVPIIGQGLSPISYLAINDLCLALEFIMSNKPLKKDFNLFSKNFINQIEMARAIKISQNKSFFYLKVPLIIIELVVSLAEGLKIKLPISKENIKGLKKNTQILRVSNLEDMGIKNNSNFSNLLSTLKVQS